MTYEWLPNIFSNESKDLTNISHICHHAFFNQNICFSGVNLSGKHPTVLTYHTRGLFQGKNKFGNELLLNSNN